LREKLVGEVSKLACHMVISDEPLADALAGMEDRGVVAATKSLADRLQGKVCQLAREMDGDLSGPGHTSPASRGDEVIGRDLVVGRDCPLDGGGR
jgi:hypothetical protein